MKALDIGYVVSLTLFFVFCGFSILIGRGGIQLSKLGSELRSEARMYKLNLLIEEQSKAIRPLDLDTILAADQKTNRVVHDLKDSESWEMLESSLSAYADRIELLSDQQRSHSSLATRLYFASVISMAAFGIARIARTSKKSSLSADPLGSSGEANL